MKKKNKFKSDKIDNMPCLIIMNVWHIDNVHQHITKWAHTQHSAHAAGVDLSEYEYGLWD